MAKSSIIGQLRVALGLDSAQFESGLSRSQRRLKEAEGGFRGSAGSMTQSMLGINVAGTIAGLSVAAVGKAMLDAARSTAQYADDLDAAATRIGLTAEQLQELRHAGEVSDIAVGALDAGLQNLNNSLGAMQTGVGNAKMKKAFEALDIKPDQLSRMNNAADLIPLLADRISKLQTQAEKVRLLRAVGGEDLLPLLNQGADGVRRLTGEMSRLGMLTNEEVAAAADMNEEMRKADERMENASRRLSLSLIPALSSLKTYLAFVTDQWANFFSGAVAKQDELNAAMLEEVKAQERILQLRREGRDRGSSGGRAVDEDGNRVPVTDWERALSALNAAKAKVRALQQTPPVVTAPPPVAMPGESASSGGRSGPSAEQLQRERERADLEERRRLQSKDIAEMEIAIQRARTDGDKATEFGLQQQLELTRRIIQLSDQGVQNAADLATEEQGLKLLETDRKRAADDLAQIEQKTKDLMQQEVAKKQQLVSLEKEELLTAKENLLAQQGKIDQLHDATYDSLKGGIEEAMQAAADGNLFDWFAKRLKFALMDNLALGLAEALLGYGPSTQKSNIGASLGLVGGIGHMIGLPGFANGGRIKVGGTGGVDSQLVMARATPGEIVEFNPPGNDNGQSGHAAPRDVRVTVTASPLFSVLIDRAATSAAEHGANLAVERIGMTGANRVF
jgi:hypothetical protein